MGPEYGSKLSNKFVGVIYFSGLEIVVVVWWGEGKFVPVLN
jgi:hypothetical protein